MAKYKIVFFFFILIFWACNSGNNEKKAASTTASIEVTDATGKKVSLSQPAERIVCLFDPAMDNIYMLQAQDKLIGIPVETYTDGELMNPYRLIDDRIKNKTIATPGSNEAANLESIIQLKPDLVIVQHLPQGSVDALAKMNIAVYQVSATTYKDVIKEVADIGKLTGKEKKAEELLSFATAELKKLQDFADTIASSNRKKVYFTWANGRIFSTTGINSNMHTILEYAAVENVCKVNIDQPNISPEILVVWNPDMIVMWNDSPDLFYSRSEFSNIAAIKHRQIYNLMPMFFYNPHTLKALCAAVAIRNWAYSPGNKIDMSFIHQYINKFYGDTAGEQLKTLL